MVLCCYILYIDWLQPCQATPKNGVGWKSLQELHKRIEECVLWPEHDCWANDDRPCKGCLHSQFTFASLAYVERGRGNIGSDPRNLDEPLNTGPLRLACDPTGRFHMHRMKCLLTAFDVEADGVHHAVRSGDGSSNRAFIVDIGEYRLKRGSFGGARSPVRVPRGDPSRQTLTE